MPPAKTGRPGDNFRGFSFPTRDPTEAPTTLGGQDQALTAKPVAVPDPKLGSLKEGNTS